MSKRPITPTYTFTPASQTLNLSGIASFDIRNLFAVINLKTGALLYAPMAGFGYSAITGTTLTLVVATAAMSAADPLMIIYDDGADAAADQQAITALAATATREGSLGTAQPDPFLNTASGKLGAIGFIWQYSKAAAASLASLVGLGSSVPFNSGALTANGVYTFPVGFFATNTFALTGTGIGSIALVGTEDGTTYDVPMKARAFGAGSTPLDTIPAATAGAWNGAYFVEAAGLQGVQLQLTLTSGSVTVRGVASKLTKSMRVHTAATDPLPVVPTAAPASVSASNTLTNSGDLVLLACDGMATIDIEALCASAAWTGTVVLEMQPKGSTQWYPVSFEPFEGGLGVTAIPTAVMTQLLTRNAGGIAAIRARATSAITNGPLTVNLSAHGGIKSLRVNSSAYGVGDSFPLAVAKAQANGAALPVPAGARSMLVELPPGSSIKYAMKVAATPAAPAALSSAPTGQVNRPNPFTTVTDFEMPVGNGRVMYVTDWGNGTDGSAPVITFL